MFYNNSPYAKSGNAPTSPYKPDYASGGGLNQNPGGMQQGGMQNPDGFIQQQNPWAPANWMNPGNRPQDSQSGGGWNPNGFNGFIGAGSNAPYNGPIGGGFSQNMGPEMPPTVNPGQPGQATNAPNPSVPAGPTMPQFVMGGANNPAVNLNGRDNPRRFMQRPSLSPQQMRQLTRPGQQQQQPPTDKPVDPYQSPPIIPPYPEY
jgi:hypothetical protein